MNRIIKFRLWDSYNKCFTKYHSFGGFVNPIKSGEDTVELAHLAGYELMQFTGLTDKNGKEIYEGDLVKANTPYSTNDLKQVIWDDKRAGFYLKCDFVAYDPKNLYKMSAFKMEVVGNIYENPKLLK